MHFPTILTAGLLFGRAAANLIDQRYALTCGSDLAQYALGKVLSDATPIFGPYRNVQSNTSTWMKAYPDSTLITHMNLPGTHDAATWNYSQETQDRLRSVTNLGNITQIPPNYWRCQNRSYIDSLNDGIRVFDLRYNLDVTNTSLVFWHGSALQSETATVDDAMYGYYKWLDDHPSETIMLSFQYQSNTYGANNAAVQLQLFNALTSPAARKYIAQEHTLGTLGSVRGKIILLRRFDLTNLPANYTAVLPGLHFSPNDWTDNGANITLHYNDRNDTAYIEDFYHPDVGNGSLSDLSIRWKVNATESHLQYAAGNAHPDDLFWTFASSTTIDYIPPSTPVMQALGNGSATPLGGVNNQLVSFLKGFEGKRLGIVMFDFYEEPSGLLPLFLSLLPPSQ